MDVSSALDDARSFLARRDAPRAAHAFDAVARARFFFSRIESQAAFELALDALSLAAHAVTTGDDTHDPTRLAGAELGSSAATVVASVIRDAGGETRRLRRARCGDEGRGCVSEGRLARERVGETVVERGDVERVGVDGDRERGIVSAAGRRAVAGLGEFAFETPAAAAQYAYAYAYGVIENDGFDAACTLLEAWEVMDVGDEYTVSRKSLFGRAARRRVMENVFVSGAVSKATMVNLARRCETDSRIGNVRVGRAFPFECGVEGFGAQGMCAQSDGETASVLEKWLATSTRDVTLEARALACISSFSACVDIDESNGPLRSLKTLLARATPESIFAHARIALTLSRGEENASRRFAHLTRSDDVSDLHECALHRGGGLS